MAKASDLFWFAKPAKDKFFIPFGWIIISIIIFSLPFIRNWAWFFIPIVLFYPLRTLYAWWIGWDKWYREQKWAMLEVTPPKEILAPFRAMEDVFSVIWTVYDKANWREIWCEGELPLAPYWISWEIACIEGKIHFYIRCLRDHRHIIESVLYAHYPDIEIMEALDYTQNVPQDAPNEEWEFYGEDFVLRKEAAYPIKTYPSFFEENVQTDEEKRIDPIVSLLEDMGRLGPGEQLWIQFITAPITSTEIPWTDEANKIISKVARRPSPKKPKSIGEELRGIVTEVLSGGTAAEKDKERALPLGMSEEGLREMILTPGEREVLFAVENKIKKAAFKTNIRTIYIAKRDSFKSPHGKIARSYFPHFMTQNLNFILFSIKTRPKVHYVLRERRKYYRKRRLLRLYIQRFPPSFPELQGHGDMILNTEEMATLFHFPMKIGTQLASSISAVEAKKGGPPPTLPVE